MPTNNWLGTVEPVAKVGTIDITNGDAATTYNVTVNGVSLSVTGVASANTIAADLQALLAASVNPYFQQITWTVNGSVITAIAFVAGVPYIVTTSAVGGGGTMTGLIQTVADTGPNHYDNIANWSLNALPTAGDDVVIADNDTSINWGLDQSGAGTYLSFTVKASYLGRIGLDRNVFVIDAEGDNPSNTRKDEYREDYLIIRATRVDLGESFGPGNPVGSSRIKLDLGNVVSTVTVHGTAARSVDIGLAAFRLKTNNASTDLFIRSAPGGVGLAKDEPGETSLINLISMGDPTSNATTLTIGNGVTMSKYEQAGGTGFLDSAAVIPEIVNDGGTLFTEGNYQITLINITGGTVVANNNNSAGSEIIDVVMTGGTIDGSQSTEPRTWDEVQFVKGATIIYDKDVVLIGTLTNNHAGPIALSAA